MNDPASGVFESSQPFDTQRIHAAAVYCSDGRYGKQFDDLLQNRLGLPRYDRLAVPGGAACLARHFKTYREEEGVTEQLRFLIETHGLQRVVLVAHQDCGFYLMRLGVSPLQLEGQQRDDMRKAIERVRSLDPHLHVEAWFARRRRQVVRFERVDV